MGDSFSFENKGTLGAQLQGGTGNTANVTQNMGNDVLDRIFGPVLQKAQAVDEATGDLPALPAMDDSPLGSAQAVVEEVERFGFIAAEGEPTEAQNGFMERATAWLKDRDQDLARIALDALTTVVPQTAVARGFVDNLITKYLG